MGKLYITSLLLLLGGCGVGNDTLNTASMQDRNITNISRLSLGMSEAEVLQIMRQPYSRENFLIGEDVYEVLFYVTQFGMLGQTRMVPQNLTPLTFKNGVLVGWGYVYYNWLVKTEELSVAQEQPTTKPKTEDKSLEKALEAPPTEPGAPVQPAAPVQPTPVQPPPPKQPPAKPAKPPAPPKKPKPAAKPPEGKPMSMSAKPKAEPPPQKPPEEEDKSKVPLKKEDSDMLEEESEQNFDFW